MFKNISLGDPKKKQRREVIIDAIGLSQSPSFKDSSLDVQLVEKASEPCSLEVEKEPRN